MFLTRHVSTDHTLVGYPGHNKQQFNPLSGSPEWWQLAHPRPTRGPAIPDWSKPFRVGPSGCIKATEDQICASSPDVPQGQTGSQVKDIGGRNSCVATLRSPQIPRWTHQSSPVNPSGLLSVCFLSPRVPPLSAPPPTQAPYLISLQTQARAHRARPNSPE